MLFRQGHGGVEADDREASGDLDNLLQYGGAYLGQQKVELRRVVPRQVGAVVAVVDESLPAVAVVDMTEGDRRVAVVPVAVLDEDADFVAFAQVGTAEAIAGVGRHVGLDVPVGMFDDPARADPRVVGHHVAGQADAALAAAFAKLLQGVLAAEARGDDVIVERVGGGLGVGVAAHLLDALRGLRALPDADQPQRRDVPAGQPIEFGIGDVVEPAQVAAVLARDLVQPDMDRLGHQHHVRHPVRVKAVAARLGGALLAEFRYRRGPGTAATHLLLLAPQIEGAQDAGQKLFGQPRRPVFAGEVELGRKVVRRMLQRQAEQLRKGEVERGAGRFGAKKAVNFFQEQAIAALLLQGVVVEQPALGTERRVACLDRQGEQLGQALVVPCGGLPGREKPSDVRFPPDHGGRGKVLDEASQRRGEFVQLFGSSGDLHPVAGELHFLHEQVTPADVHEDGIESGEEGQGAGVYRRFELSAGLRGEGAEPVGRRRR